MSCFCQNSISVEVQRVKSSDGNISVAVYNSSESFLKFGEVFKTYSTKEIKGKTQLHLEDLPECDYALAIFHDENANDKLDTIWLGIPREAVCFSNSKMKMFGPPGFKECVIDLHKDRQVTVFLE
jgi:uncharacterized protein (DUF2141 family)